MSVDTIRTVGVIVKKEKLASVEHDTHSKALVLESLLPYPGYHGTTIPDTLEPESLFAVTKTEYTEEEIIRAIQNVKKDCKINFDAAPGILILENSPVNIIRFKDLPYNKVGDVINPFENSGIVFKKARKIGAYEGIIRIFKYFNLSKLSDGIYEDEDVKEFFYLKVNDYPDWDTFNTITKEIRYNIEDIIFDAAQLSIFGTSGMEDFVRIYDKNRYTDKLATIRKYYLQAYSRL